jgi:hypothetical protein
MSEPTPTILIVYGASGLGKSVDVLYSFPDAVFLCPAPGGLVAWRALTGVQPREIIVNSIDEAVRQITTAGKGAAGRYVVLEDFSILAERTVFALERRLSGWDVWSAFSSAVLRLREAALTTGIGLVLTCHEAPRRSEDGNVIKGGPKMPSKSTVMHLPHIGMLVLRAVTGTMVPPPLWTGYYSLGDANWTGKDRYCVVPFLGCPMNLREVLVRAAQVNPAVQVPPRPAMLKSAEKAVDQVAAATLGGMDQKTIATELGKNYVGVDPRLLRWIHRDGFARAMLSKGPGLFDAYAAPSA